MIGKIEPLLSVPNVALNGRSCGNDDNRIELRRLGVAPHHFIVLSGFLPGPLQFHRPKDLVRWVFKPEHKIWIFGFREMRVPEKIFHATRFQFLLSEPAGGRHDKFKALSRCF